MVLRIRHAGYDVWYTPTLVLDHHMADHRTSVAYLRRLLRANGRLYVQFDALFNHRQQTGHRRVALAVQASKHVVKIFVHIVLNYTLRLRPVPAECQALWSLRFGGLESALTTRLEWYGS